MDGDARARAPKRARRIIDSLSDDERDQLRDDPIAYLTSRSDIEVRRRTAQPTGSCWLAGTYRWRTDEPALITINATDSPERQCFTILHEYGHHLHMTSQATADLLDLPTTRQRPVEEATCDAFASLAIFGPWIDALKLGAHGPCADDIAHLYTHANGSTWAACFAAAALLPHEGWVAVADLEGRIDFAASAHLDVGFRPGGAALVSLPVLEAAARHGRSQQTSSFVLHTGSLVGSYNVEAVRAGEHVFAVFTRGPAAWGTPAVTDARPEATECEHCDKVFVPYGAACRTCGFATCPRCGRCGCRSLVESQLCPTCYVIKPAACFTVSPTMCDDCA